MKKYFTSLAAAALLSFSAASFAQSFSVTPGAPAGSTFDVSKFDAVNSVFGTKSSFLSFLAAEDFSLSNAVSGNLFFNNGGNRDGSVIAEYLGKEAGYTNLFTITGATGIDGNTLSTATSGYGELFGGQKIGATAAPGNNQVMTMFSSVQSGRFTPGVLFILNSTGTEALGLFNDSGRGDKDYDDMVVRFSGVNGIVAPPIPEPSTYAMLLAGLGAIGFMANRRKTLVK